MTRLLCVTVYVFDPSGQYTLVVNHRKLRKWLPPGGKVDPNEIPDDAAVRECLEETGAHVTLVGERFPSEGGLVRPYGMQLNILVPGQLEHIDIIYCALADKSEKVVLNAAETTEVAWLPVETVLSPDFVTFDTVRQWTKRLALEAARTALR